MAPKCETTSPKDSSKEWLYLKSKQDAAVFYRDQEQSIWPELWWHGPGKACKLVLESPDLDALGLSIVKTDEGFPGTSAGSTKILSEWSDVDAGFNDWSELTFKLGDPPSEQPIKFPLTLTAYTKESSTGIVVEVHRTTWTHQWITRTAPTYNQPALTVFPQSRTMTVTALPLAEDDCARLKQGMCWADFEPSGYYLNPNTPLTVDVSWTRPVNYAWRYGVEMVVGTPALVNPAELDEEMPGQLRRLPLSSGLNVVSSPLGGIIYIRYNNDSAGPVKVTLGSSALPFPLFRTGVTTTDEWSTMLHATQVPFAELVGKRVIVTGLAAHARVHHDGGQDQQALLDTYASIVAAQDAISSLDTCAVELRDRPSLLRPMVVTGKDTDDPNATSYRVAIPVGCDEELWCDYEVCRSWMIWHELGHHRQHTATWSWEAVSEATVNIYTLAARRLFPKHPAEHGTSDDWYNAKDYLAEKNGTKNFDEADFFVQLVMFEQLRVAFGDAFYHELHALSRASPDQEDEASKKQLFMTLAAQIANQDLTQYFTKWGLNPEQRTVDEMSQQPSTMQDYTTVPVYEQVQGSAN